MKRDVLFVCAGALSLSMICSCSLLAPSTQTLRITASEKEAEIFVDGRHIGTAPVNVPLLRNVDHRIEGRVGSRIGRVLLGTRVSTTGTLDSIGAYFLLIPIIGLASPGFHSLARDHVHVFIPEEDG